MKSRSLQSAESKPSNPQPTTNPKHSWKRALALVQLASVSALTITLAMTPMAHAQCVAPPDGTMVAWYPFDEPVGFGGPSASNLASGNSASNLVYPTPVGGEVGNALLFNGASDYLDSPDSIVTNFGPAGVPGSNFLACNVANSLGNPGDFSSCSGNFSLDVWVNVTALPARGVMTIVDKRDTNATGYSFGMYNLGTSTRLILQLNGVNYSSTIVTFPVGQWEHLAVTVRRAAPQFIKFYINSALITNVGPPLISASLVNKAQLRIGANGPYDGPINFFNGALDELEIYNRVLQQPEVASIYNAGTFGKCKP